MIYDNELTWILKWVGTAMYHISRHMNCGDMSLHKPCILYIYSRYLHFSFLKWPLTGCLVMGVPRYQKDPMVII